MTTQYNFDSTIVDLANAIKSILGRDVVRPNIDYYMKPSLDWLTNQGMAPADQELYTKLYDELIRPHFTFDASHVFEQFHAAYGFNQHKLNHPMLNDMMLDVQRYHYKFMKSIIATIERDVRMTEIQQGWKYAEDDRWFLVREKAMAVRATQLQDQWVKAQPPVAPVDYREYNDIMHRVENTKPDTIADMVANFNDRHPFLSGFFAATIAQKVSKMISDKP